MLKNKIRYLLLLAVIGVLSILYNQYRMGILFLTVLTMPFLLFAVLSYLYGRVTAKLNTTVHVANKGDSIPIDVQLNNPTIFPISNLKIYITYQNSFTDKIFKKELSVSVDSRTRTNATFYVYSEYSGNLKVKLNGIRIYDYIKLFSLKRKMDEEIRIAVLPHFYEIEEDYTPNHNKSIVESDYYSHIRGGDDPSEVFAIREYKEGDRLQRIHWKLSIKQDKLMIKEFSDPINCSVLIFTDTGIPKGEDMLMFMDALLECSLSLSRFFLLKEQFHYFAWYDRNHGACKRLSLKQENDLYEAVDGLMQTKVAPFEEDTLKVYLAEHAKEQYTEIYYITGAISDSNLESLSTMKSAQKHIIYVSDLDRTIGEEEGSTNKMLPEEIMNKTADMGIEIIGANKKNMKETMEHFKFII